MAPERANQFKIMMSDEELSQLRRIAEHEGLTASDIVRQFVRRRHLELFGAPEPKKPKRK
jgi:hypothetical protein